MLKRKIETRFFKGKKIVKQFIKIKRTLPMGLCCSANSVNPTVVNKRNVKSTSSVGVMTNDLGMQIVPQKEPSESQKSDSPKHTNKKSIESPLRNESIRAHAPISYNSSSPLKQRIPKFTLNPKDTIEQEKELDEKSEQKNFFTEKVVKVQMPRKRFLSQNYDKKSSFASPAILKKKSKVYSKKSEIQSPSKSVINQQKMKSKWGNRANPKILHSCKSAQKMPNRFFKFQSREAKSKEEEKASIDLKMTDRMPQPLANMNTSLMNVNRRNFFRTEKEVQFTDMNGKMESSVYESSEIDFNSCGTETLGMKKLRSERKIEKQSLFKRGENLKKTVKRGITKPDLINELLEQESPVRNRRKELSKIKLKERDEEDEMLGRLERQRSEKKKRSKSFNQNKGDSRVQFKKFNRQFTNQRGRLTANVQEEHNLSSSESLDSDIKSSLNKFIDNREKLHRAFTKEKTIKWPPVKDLVIQEVENNEKPNESSKKKNKGKTYNQLPKQNIQRNKRKIPQQLTIVNLDKEKESITPSLERNQTEREFSQLKSLKNSSLKRASLFSYSRNQLINLDNLASLKNSEKRQSLLMLSQAPSLQTMQFNAQSLDRRINKLLSMSPRKMRQSPKKDKRKIQRFSLMRETEEISNDPEPRETSQNFGFNELYKQFLGVSEQDREKILKILSKGENLENLKNELKATSMKSKDSKDKLSRVMGSKGKKKAVKPVFNKNIEKFFQGRKKGKSTGTVLKLVDNESLDSSMCSSSSMSEV